MEKTFKASYKDLHSMLDFIRAETEAIGFEVIIVARVELAVEEAIVNIIKHSGVGEQGTITISCEPLVNVGIKIILKDKGNSFHPTIRPRKLKMNLEEMPLGGYGVNLIHTLMDQVTYDRIEDTNVLTLVKLMPK